MKCEKLYKSLIVTTNNLTKRYYNDFIWCRLTPLSDKSRYLRSGALPTRSDRDCRLNNLLLLKFKSKTCEETKSSWLSVLLRTFMFSWSSSCKTYQKLRFCAYNIKVFFFYFIFFYYIYLFFNLVLRKFHDFCVNSILTIFKNFETPYKVTSNNTFL